MRKFDWNNKYSVNINSIDEQHKQFLNLINRVINELTIEKDPEKLRNLLKMILAEFGEYAFYHLLYEEEHFVEYNYDKADEHTLEHEMFRDKITALLKRTKDPKEDLIKVTEELAEFAGTWLIHHIEVVDKEYAECFKKHNME